MTPEPSRPKVVSIVGVGRSGTTILASILGQIEGVFSAGELRWLWSRDLVMRRPCACSRAPHECPVWAPVAERTLGLRPEQQHTEQIQAAVGPLVEAQREVAAMRYRWKLLRGASDPDGEQQPSHQRVTEATRELLTVLFDVTGSNTIVDGSKRPEEAAIIASSESFDHYVLHVVRDPRAVVHSWNRTKTVKTADETITLPPRRPAKTVAAWMENSAGAALLRRHTPAQRWLFLRYEDFARRPRETVQGVLDFLGVRGEAPFTSEHTVELGVSHELSGNPNRFHTGSVTIRTDQEWAARMPRHQQLAIQAITSPFLASYGYLGRESSNA
jgi:hypothetical protein